MLNITISNHLDMRIIIAMKKKIKEEKYMYKDNEPQIGALTEQGDLGLGFDVFTESEQQQLKEQEDKNK